jgi:hypothetical protein
MRDEHSVSTVVFVSFNNFNEDKCLLLLHLKLKIILAAMATSVRNVCGGDVPDTVKT